MYSQKQPSQEQMVELNVLIEQTLFTCGSNLIPDDHDLSEVFAVQTNIGCGTDVSYHYFSCALKLVPVCYKCGSKDELVFIPQEEKQLYQSIHTVCATCKAGGAIFRMRNKVKTAKKTSAKKRPYSQD